ncbi:protein of unknown function [Taphrina deformans PYCC 5710]|uniref:Threonyl/alanyl tRNA synthetase SAD domain-containing protein n=1 Tax=Taphrina deformans (strain PYCC 5710 / ATCC 11124 / CBS 356.35 / IMI 108563 / JCM 9778 / NBRC 8474) TaxID=1097556 RepID=R4XGV7_TAPDE|nr:protein of unknown function [Taphrina deformans PYCC 5710]|eukprot:CCG83733.1 protein of unknown function [Taphrina deformans PYCC 5710]
MGLGLKKRTFCPHGVLNGTNEAKRVVGNLACQHDTYLQRLSTTVCDCQKNSLKKPSKDEAYEVQFLDTILFPEGGGQPWDHGSVVAMKDGQPTEIPVRKVLRRKLEAIHYVPTPIEVGTQVELKLDFDRRFDQAQQHSGQHLLSAVLDTLDIPTLAWSMGPELVYIEVPRLPEDLKAVERQCNKHIADNLTITVTETRERPKNLPADYDASAGVIRVVSIGGIDANPCCGTHVRSTAELNSLTILYTNPIKGANRNNHRIYFVVGGRCQKLLSEVHGNARTMGANLSCQISDLPEKITVMQNQLKELMKREKNLKSDLVQFDSQVVRAKLEKTGKAYLHKPTGDIEYLNALLAALPNPIPGICVLVAGERDGGPIVITGEETQVKELSARVKQALPAMKGGGRPQKFQGKVAAYAAKDLVFLGNLLD